MTTATETRTDRTFECPVCGGSASLGYTKRGDRWLVNCFQCVTSGGAFIRELADALGVPAGVILNGPPAELEEYAVATRSGSGPPAPLPSGEDLRRQRRDLRRSREAMRYLRRERGLTDASIRRYGLGLGVYRDRRAIAIPVLSPGGALLNVRWRALPGEEWMIDGEKRKILTPRGGGSQLYPDVPDEGWLLLVEGEFDAIVTRQNGLPAITSTTGQSLRLDLCERLRGRQIAVCFDVGARPTSVVDRLCALGADARPVFLDVFADLPDKYDLSDWFNDGRTVAKLKRTIRYCWREARR